MPRCSAAVVLGPVDLQPMGRGVVLPVAHPSRPVACVEPLVFAPLPRVPVLPLVGPARMRSWVPDFSALVVPGSPAPASPLDTAIQYLSATSLADVPACATAVFSLQPSTRRQYCGVLRSFQRRLPPSAGPLTIELLEQYVQCMLLQQGPVSTLKQLFSALGLAALCGVDVPAPTPRLWRSVSAIRQVVVPVAPVLPKPLVSFDWIQSTVHQCCSP